MSSGYFLTHLKLRYSNAGSTHYQCDMPQQRGKQLTGAAPFKRATASFDHGRVMSLQGQTLEASDRLSDLYRRHSSWLVASVRRRGAGDAAEDVVQEAFIRVAHYPETIELRHPKALLLKIALNVVREAARRGAAVKHRPPVFDGTIDEAIGAEQFELVLLKQTVMALPETYRDVFLLNRFGGMSYQEIAEACGVSIKTVEWRMSRALAMCAARMRD